MLKKSKSCVRKVEPLRMSSDESTRIKDFSSLPIVDIRQLYSTKPGNVRKAAMELGRAAHNYGFLYIKGHRVSQGNLDSAYAVAQRFFERPIDFKNQYYIGNSYNHRGYVPVSEKGDYADEKERYYEAFDLALDLPANYPGYTNGNPLLGPNVWPAIKGFYEVVSEYYAQLGRLGRLLTAAFEIYLGVPAGTLSDRMSKPIAQLRLLHYLERSHGQKGSNMGAHTDYECFTILHQQSSGLQVLNLANRWVDVEPIEGTFVINIGDLLEVWSSGHFLATPHRVISRGGERLSMPYFVAANYDAIIKPIFNMHGTMYRPLVAGHHMMRMLVRDFPYLRKRHGMTQFAALGDSFGSRSPFEGRIRNADANSEVFDKHNHVVS